MKKCGKEIAWDAASIALLVLYISSQLIFKLSLLPESIPFVMEHQWLGVCENLTGVLSLVIVLGRRKAFCKGQLLLILVSTSVLILSYAVTSDGSILLGYLVVIAVSRLDIKRMMDAYAVTSSICLIAIITLSIFGLIYNKDTVPKNSIVFSYGFSHPNRLAGILVSLSIAITVSFYEKKWQLAVLINGLITAFIFFALRSYTATGVSILGLIANAICHVQFARRLALQNRALYTTLTTLLPLALVLLMLYCTVAYDEGNLILKQFNSFVHARPRYAHDYFLSNGGLSLFGKQQVYTDSYRTGIMFQTVDCSYCYFALISGLIPLVLLGLNYLVAVRHLYRHRKRLLFAFVFAISAIYGVMELYPMYVCTNATLLLISAAFFETAPNENKENLRIYNSGDFHAFCK